MIWLAPPPLVIGAIFAGQWWGKLLLAIGVFNTISAALFIYATRRGKFQNIKQDRDKAVREADRVCKAKGRIVFVDIERALRMRPF